MLIKWFAIKALFNFFHKKIVADDLYCFLHCLNIMLYKNQKGYYFGLFLKKNK